jgi:hypothetical protein
MEGGSNRERRAEWTASDLVRSATDKTPDATWPTEALLDFAMKALGESDNHQQHLHARVCNSVIPKFRAGHAFSGPHGPQERRGGCVGCAG